MNEKRPIRFSTLLKIVRGDRPFFLLGAIFTGIAVFIMFPLFTVIAFSLEAPHNRYDVEAIEKYGVKTTAHVTVFKMLLNESVNGQHPTVISYAYNLNGRPYTDQFETLNLNSLPLAVNDDIQIKVYNGQSIIEGIQPFRFSILLFYILPFIFLVAGVPFLLIGLGGFLKTLKLYKYGVVKEASVVAMQPVLPHGKNNFKPYVLVDYYFTGTTGQRIMGKASTHDMTFLATKKMGDKIKVFVLEEDEHKSCLVPMEEAEKNGWMV